MKPISCNHCKAVNASDARVCYQCKKILSIGSHAICESCYHRNPLHLVNCVNCGMELNESKEKEVESAMALEASTVSGATGPLISNGNDSDHSNTNVEDPAFFEQVTKKHEVPEFAQNVIGDNKSTKPLDSVEPPAEHADNMDINNKNLPEMPNDRALQNGKYENHNEPVEESSADESTNNEEVDILSMLDLDLDQDKFVSEPPRSISEDQLQPTDWISELVPHTDELPTMADMLPDPLPSESAEESDMMEMPGSVMDMLFGDTGKLDEETVEEVAQAASLDTPSVPNFEVEAPEDEPANVEPLSFDPPAVEAEASFEAFPDQAADDSWLTDAMTDIEDADIDESLDTTAEFGSDDSGGDAELPAWMDFSTDPDENAAAEPAPPSYSAPEEKTAIEDAVDAIADDSSIEEAVTFSYEEAELNDEPVETMATADAMPDSDGITTSQDFEDDDDDALNWLIDDSDTPSVDALPEAEPVPTAEVERVDRPMQTRDLSESAIFKDLQSEADSISGIDDSSAVQADVPNWIKQMAPATDQEPVAISNADTNTSQMDDDALSAILDSMDIDPEALAEPASLSLDDVAAKALNVHAKLPPAAPEPIIDELPDMLTDIPDVPETVLDVPDHIEAKADLDFMSSAETSIEQGLADEIQEVQEAIEGVEVEEPASAVDSQFDFNEDQFDVSEEDLVRDAISAIESEIRGIKDAEPSGADADGADPDAKSPEWLSATDLNFKPAPKEDDPLGWFTDPDMDEAESQNNSEQPAADSSDAKVDASDALAAFDWGDIEDVFDSPAPSDSENLAFNAETENPLTAELSEEANASFDWLSDDSEAAEAVMPEEPVSFDADFEEPDADSLRNLQIGVPHDIPEQPSAETDEDSVPETKHADVNLDSPVQESTFDSMDLLEEPAIEVPSFTPESVEVPEMLEATEAIEAAENQIEESEDEVEAALTALVEENQTESIEEFTPLTEFEDESDVFSAVRDQPPVDNPLSAESISPYDTNSFVNMPDPSGEDSFSLHEENKNADEFFSSLTEEDQMEMPEWASELAPSTPEIESAIPSSDNNPLSGISDVVDVAPSISNQVSDLQNLHAPQMMEPIAHRKRAQMAAQAAGTVPMTDPTQPVVVPKERQKYQPRFNATQFDGRPNLNKQKRSRQIGFLVVAGVIALAVIIAIAVPIVISLFNS